LRRKRRRGGATKKKQQTPDGHWETTGGMEAFTGEPKKRWQVTRAERGKKAKL